jgi:hypothetical protein
LPWADRVEFFHLREQNDSDVLSDVRACQSHSSPIQLNLRLWPAADRLSV